MHKLLDIREQYVEETYEEAKRRYSGFAESFFDQLKTQYPGIFIKLRFYRSCSPKFNKDVNAVYSEEIEFAMALDPSCEALFIWSKKSKFLFSESDEDPVTAGLKTIGNYYLRLITEIT